MFPIPARALHIFRRHLSSILAVAVLICCIGTGARGAGIPVNFMYDTYDGDLFSFNYASGVDSFNSSGGYGSFHQVLANGSSSSGPGASGLALDANNDLFVAETAGIVEYTSAGSSIFAPASDFDGPSGMTFGPNGYLYVADAGDNEIKEVSPSGVVSEFAGPSSGLNDPTDVAFGRNGDLYVANFANGTGTGSILQITPSGSPSVYGGTEFFTNPFSIAFDSQGDLYGTNENQTGSFSDLVKVGPNGEDLGLNSVVGYIYEPLRGIAVDNKGNVYVVEEDSQFNFGIQDYGPNAGSFYFSGNDSISSPNDIALSAANAAVVPEPSAIGLAGLGALALVLTRRRPRLQPR